MIAWAYPGREELGAPGFVFRLRLWGGHRSAYVSEFAGDDGGARKLEEKLRFDSGGGGTRERIGSRGGG